MDAGGDFDSDASTTQPVDAIGFYTWTGGQLAADVQSMLETPATNFGWVIVGDETRMGTAKRFDTRENADVSRRPELVVHYLESN